MFMYPSRQARIPDLDKKSSISVFEQAISLTKFVFILIYPQLKVEAVTDLFFSIYLLALIHKREHYVSATMNIQIGETGNESSSKFSTM